MSVLASIAMAPAGFVVRPAHAQSVTTGAISGYVRDEQNQPVASAQVRVLNTATGVVRNAVTNAGGRYGVLGLEVGSAYNVSVRRIGYAPEAKTDQVVTLGQTTQVDFDVKRQAAQLSEVAVIAETNPVISPSRTGSSTVVGDTTLRRLPTLNRNFTDFVALTPQVSNTGPGLSGGGTNNRFNNIQIDGSISHDLFGLGSTGQPGGQANGKSISIESVKEYQVLLSPYDVRHGNFSGVLINAVTKSGTNDFHGALYGVTRNQSLARDQPYINDFEQSQYGAWLGGPLVKNKVLFFVNPEWQVRKVPASGPYLGSADAAVTPALVDRFNTALTSYGLPNSSGGQVNNENPLTNVFGRLDFNLPRNSSLVLRHNFAKAQDDNFSRSGSSFPLSNNGYAFTSNANSTVAQLRTNFAGGSYNEALLSYNTIRDKRRPNSYSPQVQVTTSVSTLVAGGERFSHANELDQDIFEITDNYTIPLGITHRVTVGTQNQFYKVRNLFAQSKFGVWDFVNLDSLERGSARQYIVGVPVSGDGAVRFSARQHAAYVQDEWAISPRLNLTVGVRADAPFFNDKPPQNPDILRDFGRNTSEIPSGNVQWSPRLGVNWDVTGDQKNQLRGGVGMFTGRPAYVWLANSFQNSGLSGVALLTCNAPNAPRLTTQTAATPPQQCTNGTTARAGSEVDLLRDDLKFPQNLRATLGFDRDIGLGLAATFEAMYTRGLNNPFYTNMALSGPIGTDRHGRVMYGDAPNQPRLVVAGRNVVLDVENQSKDYSYQLTAGLQRRWLRTWAGSLFYTYSHVRDVQSLTSSTAFSQYRFGRVWGGDQNDISVGRSFFEQKHKVVAQATYSLRTLTDLTFTYFGQSGSPFGYTSTGDLNGNGFTLDDPIYIPTDVRDPNQIMFRSFTRPNGQVVSVAEQQDAFDKFINGAECLRKQRGKLMERNSCDNPWTNTLNVSVRQSMRTLGTQRVSLEFSVFNFLNLLNKNWGEQPSAGFGSQSILIYQTKEAGSMVGPSGARPIFTFDPAYRRFLSSNIGSNYQIQAQLRYSF